MSVTRDIIATWRNPRRVMRRLLDMGQRDDRALMYLLLACGLIFVAQWPRLSREVTLNPDGAPLDAQLSITFFAMLMVWPIMFYGLGALVHLVARTLGGQGTWYSARLALFWSLLASTPAWLFYGLVQGVVGPGGAETAVGAGVLIVFLVFFALTLREAERAPEGAGA